MASLNARYSRRRVTLTAKYDETVTTENQVRSERVLVPLTAIPSDLTVSAGGAWLADRVRERVSIGHLIEGIGAVVVLALGIRTLMSV